MNKSKLYDSRINFSLKDKEQDDLLLEVMVEVKNGKEKKNKNGLFYATPDALFTYVTFHKKADYVLYRKIKRKHKSESERNKLSLIAKRFEVMQKTGVRCKDLNIEDITFAINTAKYVQGGSLGYPEALKLAIEAQKWGLRNG